MVPWAGLNLNLTTNLYLMFVNRFNIYLLFFFRSLQGERNSIHKNLVFCLFATEAVFVSGIERTKGTKLWLNFFLCLILESYTHPSIMKFSFLICLTKLWYFSCIKYFVIYKHFDRNLLSYFIKHAGNFVFIYLSRSPVPP